jgi:hypothetical protein
MNVSWSRSKEVGVRVVVAAIAAVLGGCGEEPPERVTVTLAMGDPSVESRDQALAPPSTQPSVGPSFVLDRPVHWIEIERCDPEAADCNKTENYRGYCFYDSAVPVWETAMGVNYPDRFDDVLRGEPAITGPIVYGELPAQAGWQSDAVPLVEGERYSINVYVYEECEHPPLGCVHTKAVGCQFFTIQNGVPVELPATHSERDVSE